MNTQIYVAAHKDSVQIPSEVFVPIHVGRRGRLNSFCFVGDDTGDHISDKNDTFCELTALYWIWKNTSSQDYVGLFHYRRHLNISEKDTPESTWGVSEYKVIDDDYINTNQLNNEALTYLVSNYDLILPKKWDVRNAGSESMYNHFDRGENHSIDDYDRALKILITKYPEYLPFIKKINDGYLGYFTNMFIMRREIFDNYCEWLFSILFELEKVLDISSYSVQERRIFGFISEWLFNIYIEKLVFDNPDMRIKHTQRTFIHNTDPKPCPLPFYSSNNTAVVMAFNNSFAPYAGVAIRSLADNANPHNNYDIVIFDGGVSECNKKLINITIKNFSNINIRYIDPEAIFSGISLPTHLHISKDTYYRLLIPEVFSRYKRVIYMDGDMIVKKDIAELNIIDLNGKSIGAVPDHVMAGFRKYKTRSVPDGVEAENYLKNILQMNNPAAYFQAGLIVYDIEKAAEALNNIKEILILGKQFWFMDQDILNMVYQENVHYLDTKWNVFHGNGNTNTFFEKLPADIRNDYFQSRTEPYIIHYAGENKPWLVADTDFAEEFWMVARNTPWYERMLFGLSGTRLNHVSQK